MNNVIPTIGTAEQIERATFGFHEDSDGCPLAFTVELADGSIGLNIGQLTNSTARGALMAIREYVAPDVFAAWELELPDLTRRRR